MIFFNAKLYLISVNIGANFFYPFTWWNNSTDKYILTKFENISWGLCPRAIGPDTPLFYNLQLVGVWHLFEIKRRI